jgi:hypothetical protein
MHPVDLASLPILSVPCPHSSLVAAHPRPDPSPLLQVGAGWEHCIALSGSTELLDGGLGGAGGQDGSKDGRGGGGGGPGGGRRAGAGCADVLSQEHAG